MKNYISFWTGVWLKGIFISCNVFFQFLSQLMWLVRLRTLSSPILKQGGGGGLLSSKSWFRMNTIVFNLSLTISISRWAAATFLAEMIGILPVVNAASILEEDCESKCGRLTLCIVAASFADLSTKRSLRYAWYVFTPFSNVLRNLVLIVLTTATLVSMLCKVKSEDIMMKGYCRAFIKSSIRATSLSNIRHLRPDSLWWHWFLNGLGFLH